MSTFTRRTMLSGALATASVATFNHLPSVRTSRAQGAAYEIVSFGPNEDGVYPEGYFWPQWGGIKGIHGAGTAFGNVPTSTEKLTPAMFEQDGTLTKLKSGTFGGAVRAINSAGTAVGIAFDTINGTGSDQGLAGQPVAWIDGEMVRLPVPEPFQDGIAEAGVVEAITDDGLMFGRGNGYALQWRNGEAEILRPDLFPESYLIHQLMLPDGTLVVRSQNFITNESVFGYLDGSEIEPLLLPPAFAAFPSFQIMGVSSDGSILATLFTRAFPNSIIVRRGMDPIELTLDHPGVFFYPTGNNARNQVVGAWQERDDVDAMAAIWEDGEFTPLDELLPSGHGFRKIEASGISDDGVIAGYGFDDDGRFHSLLFVPA